MKTRFLITFFLSGLLFISFFSGKRENNFAAAMSKAFNFFSTTNSILLQEDLKLDLQLEYGSVIGKLATDSALMSDEEFSSKLKYYSTDKGMQEVINEWYASVKKNDTSMLSTIGGVILKELHIGIDKVTGFFNPVPDKYATLIVSGQSDEDFIYVNKTSVGPIKKAKNGVMVYSDTNLLFSLSKDNTSFYCVQNIICKQQEVRRVLCK